MAEAAAEAVDQNAQASIELESGVTLTGIGGDLDAIRESIEDRQDAQAPPPAKIEPPTPAQPEVKKTRGQKRFDELTAQRETEARERAAEKLRADTAEARIKELESKFTAATTAPAPAATIEAPVTRQKPTEAMVGDKYQTYADFVEDLADWKAEQRDIKLQNDLDARSTARIEADQASRTLAATANDAFTRGRAAYPDFDAMLKSADGVIIPLDYQKAILRVPHAEHVMYGLAKDQAKLKAILAITDGVQLGMELAQFMPRESVAPPASTAPVVRTTNAPAPIQPVGAGSRTTSPTAEELAAKGEYEAYKALRAEQRRA